MLDISLCGIDYKYLLFTISTTNFVVLYHISVWSRASTNNVVNIRPFEQHNIQNHNSKRLNFDSSIIFAFVILIFMLFEWTNDRPYNSSETCRHTFM